MQWIRESQPDAGQQALFNRALTITLVGNLVLASGKSLAAYFSGGTSLYADAANSVSDVLYSVVLVLGMRLSRRPPDCSHPQGHSRFEPLVGLLVALAMGSAGAMAAKTALERYLQGGQALEAGLPTAVLSGSILIKVGMYWLLLRFSRRLHSPALRATALDDLSDVFTSGAAIGGTLGAAYWHPLIDPIVGFLIALGILYAAFDIAKENINYLTGGGAPLELRQQIVELASAVEGVRRVHQVIAEYAGPRLVVDMHINVDGEISLRQAHAIADEVQTQVTALPEVDRAYIHVEPDEG